MDLSLDRLYLLYQSGSVADLNKNYSIGDRRKNSNVLQVAKAVGKDMPLAEFEWIANAVSQVEKQFDPRKQSKDFQANLWNIPNEAKERRKTDFQPTRDSKNQPIQMDDGSPESLERILKSKSLDEVKHNSTLRNAWHAAQSGKLGELIEGNNLWTISDSQDELSNGLRGLSPVASIDSLGLSISGLKRADKDGTLDSAIAKERKSAEHDLPSFQTYKSYGLDAMKDRILSDNGKFNFVPKSMRDDVHDGKSLADIRGIKDTDERANAASAWSKGFRDKHEQSIQQSVIDRRLNGFASGKNQSPRMDQKPTLDMLRKSVMSSKKGNSSEQVVAPPVQSADRPTLDELRKSYTKSNVAGESESGDKVEYSPHDSNPEAKNQSEKLSPLDWAQLALDGAGILEPTPFADLTNAGISLGRAAFDPKNSGQHLMNAGISIASTIPYVGDFAKFGKSYGKGGKATSKAFEELSNSKFGKAAVNMLGGMAGFGNSGGGSSGGGGGASGNSGGGSSGGGGGVSGNSGGGSAGGGGGASGNSGGGAAGGGGGASGNSGGGAAGGGGRGPTSFVTMAASAIGVVTAFKLLVNWITKTADSGKELLENQRQLALYSGRLSAAFEKYNTSAVFRNIRKAEYLGSSAAGLAGSQARYQDAKAFSNAPIQRTWNNVTSMATELATIATYVKSFTNAPSLLLRGLYAIVDATKSSKPGDPTHAIEAHARKLDKDKDEEDGKKNPPVKDTPRLPADGMRAGGMHGFAGGGKLMP